MNRRKFIKSSLLWVPVAPAILKAQDVVPLKRKGGGLPQLPNLFEAWESSAFDGQSNNTAITTWTGKNGHTANSNVASEFGKCTYASPTVDTSVTLGGHNTIKILSGSSQAFKGPNTYANSVGNGGEMVLVLRSDGAAGGCPSNFQGSAGQASDQQYFPFSDSNVYCAFCRTDRPNMNGSAFGIPWSSQFNVLEFSAKSDGTAYDTWVNRTNHIYTSASFPFQYGDALGISFGGMDNGVACAFGSIHLAAVYQWFTYFSAADRTQLYSYLDTKWGLAL